MVSASTVMKDWPELIGLLFLLLAFAFAISIQNLWMNYTIILLAGLMAGRVIFNKRGHQPLFPFILIIIIFLVGYLLGSIRFNRIPIFLIFVVATWGSYRLHKEGYLPH